MMQNQMNKESASFLKFRMIILQTILSVVTLTYDTTTKKMTIDPTGTTAPTCAGGMGFRLIVGTTPAIIHSAILTVLPSQTRVFDLNNFQTWTAGVLSALTTLTSYATSIPVDHSINFVCSDVLATLTGAVQVTVTTATGTITGIDVVALTFTRTTATKFFVGLTTADCVESCPATDKIKLIVKTADNSKTCTQEVAIGSGYPYMLDFADGSFTGTSCTGLSTLFDTTLTYVVYAQQVDSAGTTIKKQFALPAITPAPKQTVKLAVDTTATTITVTLENTGTPACTQFNLMFTETFSNKVVLTQQEFLSTALPSQTIALANLQLLDTTLKLLDGSSSPTAAAWLANFKLYPLVGITCTTNDVQTIELYHNQQVAPGTLAADSFAKRATAVSGNTAVYTTTTFVANLYDVGTTVQFKAGETVVINASCTYGTTTYTTKNTTVIPTYLEVASQKLRIVVSLVQDTTPALLLAMIAIGKQTCVVNLARAGTSITIIDSPALTVASLNTLSYDKTNKKMKIAFDAAVTAPTCTSGKFRFTAGTSPLLVHKEELIAVPASTRVFNVLAMTKLAAGVESALTTDEITALETTLATNKQVGFVCTTTLSRVTDIIFVTKVSMQDTLITTDDTAMDNTVAVRYDSTAKKVSLTFVQAKEFTACKTEYYIYVQGNSIEPKLQHQHKFSAIISDGTVIALDQIAMTVSAVGTITQTYLDATTATTFWTNFAAKAMVGFQCVTGSTMTTQVITVASSATATLTATADSYITDPAVVVYDATANKVIFTALASTTTIPSDCTAAFSIMFGKVPLVHRNVLAALPAVGLVYDITNMKKYDATVPATPVLSALVDADKTTFKTAFITDKQVGIICPTKLDKTTAVVATIIAATIPSTLVDTTNTAAIKYDVDKKEISVTFVRADLAPTCGATDKMRFTFGSAPMAIHVLTFTAAPLSAETVFAISTLQKLDVTAGTVSELTDAERTAIKTTLAADKTIGLVCSAALKVVTSYPAVLTEAAITGTDAAANKAIVLMDKTNSVLQVRLLAPTLPSCGVYKLTLGSEPKFVHPKQFTAVPTITEVFAISNMKKLNTTDGTISALDENQTKAFDTSIATDAKVGLVCLSDMKTETVYTIFSTDATKTITEKDAYVVPVIDVSIKNEIVYNSTEGTFNVSVANLTATNVTFKKDDVIKITITITDTSVPAVASGLKAVTSYTSEPYEFIASDTNVVGGQLNAAIKVVPKAADKTAVDALMAKGPTAYKATPNIYVNNAAITVTIATTSTSPSGLSGGAIAGIVIGSVVFAGGVAVGLYFLIRHCKNKKSGDPKKNDKKEEPMKKNKKDINEPEEPPKSSKFGKNTDKNIDQSSTVQQQQGTVMKNATLNPIKDGKQLPKIQGTTNDLLSPPTKKPQIQLESGDEKGDKNSLSIEPSESEQRRKQFVRRKKEGKPAAKETGAKMSEEERKKTVDGLLNNAVGEEGGANDQ